MMRLILSIEERTGVVTWSYRNAWILVVVLAFGAVYASSLTYVYSDSDDAVSMAYHALGRNDYVQPPFERFQYGMDLLLSMLPAHEPTVRVVGMSITAMASGLLVILVLMLAWMNESDRQPVSQLAGAVAFLLAVPEFFFLGLLYTPMLVGMCLAVGAHIMVRQSMRVDGVAHRFWGHDWLLLAGSAIMIGVAGLFRWDLMAYVGIVALDQMCRHSDTPHGIRNNLRNRFAVIALWCVLATCVWICLVMLAGGFSKAMEEIGPAIEETHDEVPFTQTQFIGAHLSLFTPGFLVFAVLGLVGYLKKAGGTKYFFMLALFSLAIWPFQSTPKEILVFVPVLVMLFAHGWLKSIAWVVTRRFRIPLLGAVFSLLLLPWLLAVNVLHGDSSWGPGFELRPFSHPVSSGLRSLQCVAAAGAACPTNEGLRPVFGYGWTLLGGGWRSMASIQDAELTQSVEMAARQNLPYLIIRDADGFQTTTAARMGFTTSDPELKSTRVEPVVRNFINSHGSKIRFIRFHYDELTKAPNNILLTIRAAGVEKVLVWGEAGYMRLLYRAAPEALEEVGRQTAILDLRLLYKSVKGRSL
jgi:hypothetical protein